MKKQKKKVGDEPAMQQRCVNCAREQYMPSVYAISRGKAECPWCGMPGEKMSMKIYLDKLRNILMEESSTQLNEMDWMIDAYKRANVVRKRKKMKPVTWQ